MIYAVLIAAVAVAIIVTVGIRCDDSTDFVYRYPTPRKESRFRSWFKDAGRIEFKRKGDELSFHIGMIWILIFIALIWWVVV